MVPNSVRPPYNPPNTFPVLYSPFLNDTSTRFPDPFASLPPRVFWLLGTVGTPACSAYPTSAPWRVFDVFPSIVALTIASFEEYLSRLIVSVREIAGTTTLFRKGPWLFSSRVAVVFFFAF